MGVIAEVAAQTSAKVTCYTALYQHADSLKPALQQQVYTWLRSYLSYGLVTTAAPAAHSLKLTLHTLWVQTATLHCTVQYCTVYAYTATLLHLPAHHP
jgi:hypothetical protein